MSYAWVEYKKNRTMLYSSMQMQMYARQIVWINLILYTFFGRKLLENRQPRISEFHKNEYVFRPQRKIYSQFLQSDGIFFSIN